MLLGALVLICALFLMFGSQPKYWYDSEHNVSCWIIEDGISCLDGKR